MTAIEIDIQVRDHNTGQVKRQQLWEDMRDGFRRNLPDEDYWREFEELNAYDAPVRD